MAQTIKLKRSSTPANIPTTGQLALGEVAINTYDGKMYIKKDDGAEAVVEIGAAGGSVALDDLTDVVITTPATDEILTYDSGNWVNAAPASTDLTVDNFTDTTDYTSGTTTALTLSVTPASENSILVYFDGVAQHHDGYTLAGAVVTFAVAISLGTENVEIITTSTGVTNVPGANTVTTAMIQDSAVTDAKLADSYVHTDGSDTMTGDLNLNDNVNISLGTGGDFKLYHNGGNNILKYLIGGLHAESALHTVAVFSQSAVHLYFESSPKFETVTEGVSITGTVLASAAPTLDGHLTRKDYVDYYTKPIYDSGIIDTAVTTIDISGLNLAPTETYNIVYTLKNATASDSNYFITANGFHTFTDYYSQVLRADNESIASARGNDPRFSEVFNNNSYSFGTGTIFLSPDNDFVVQVNDTRNSTSAISIRHQAISKPVSLAGNLTSLRITAAVSNAISIGSRFRIYRTL